MKFPGAKLLRGLGLVLPLAACGGEDAASPTGQAPAGTVPGPTGKADGPGVASTDLLSLHGAGTWKDTKTGLERAWVEVRVANVRYHKRVVVELAAPFADGQELRMLAPALHKGALDHGAERWGTDVFELYPHLGHRGRPGARSRAFPARPRRGRRRRDARHRLAASHRPRHRRGPGDRSLRPRPDVSSQPAQ